MREATCSFAFFVACFAWMACGDNLDSKEIPSNSTCPNLDCGAQSREELFGDIEGFSDPFSQMLREEVDEQGALAGDYLSLLNSVAEVQGCAGQKQKSFVVLANEGFFPRVVFNNCADEPNKASSFFLLAPIVEEGADLSRQELHLSAWDEENGRYRHFATSPDPEGRMRISTQPAYCLGCHGGSAPLDYWQPLMNEMRSPWSQWNSEPGFRSHLFSEFLLPEFLEAENFLEMRKDELLHPANELEPIVRAGIARVVRKRSETRFEPANLEQGLSLLRPVFCDETVNYVSEIHDSGAIASASLVDDSLRNLLASMQVGEWDFLSESRFRMQEAPWDERIVLMPIRGESTVAAEASLLTRQILEVEDILRVRVLDHANPVASAFRCGLWEKGRERILAGEIDEELEALGKDADNRALVSVLYTEIMHVVVEGQRTTLRIGELSDKILAFAEVEEDEVQNFLSGGKADSLMLSLQELGDELQLRLQGASRDRMREIRDRRACAAEKWFGGAPTIPDLQCN